MKSFYAMTYGFIAAVLVTVGIAITSPAFAHDTGTAHHQAADDPTAIRDLMHSMFDRPDAELVIEPVVVEAGFAVAGWTQGEMGGRAFLRQQDGHWRLILCAGDEIISVAGLTASGVPDEVAAALAAAIATADEGVDPARLAMFASFGDIVMMDDHPPAHH